MKPLLLAIETGGTKIQLVWEHQQEISVTDIAHL